MFNRKFDFGCVVSFFTLPASVLDLDLEAFRANATVQGLKAGRLAVEGANGVQLATSADAQFAGFIVNDAAGYSFENVPAYASGQVPLSLGGGVAETDQVVEADLVAGDVLYISDDQPGLLTKVKPTDATAFAKVLVGNSGNADKIVTLQY